MHEPAQELGQAFRCQVPARRCAPDAPRPPGSGQHLQMPLHLRIVQIERVASTIPAHFAQVGASLWALRSEGSGSYAEVLAAGATLLLLGPALALGISALVRRHARLLVALVFATGLPLLVPTRHGDWIALLGVLEIALCLAMEAAVFRRDLLFRTTEASAPASCCSSRARFCSCAIPSMPKQRCGARRRCSLRRSPCWSCRASGGEPIAGLHVLAAYRRRSLPLTLAVLAISVVSGFAHAARLVSLPSQDVWIPALVASVVFLGLATLVEQRRDRVQRGLARLAQHFTHEESVRARSTTRGAR